MGERYPLMADDAVCSTFSYLCVSEAIIFAVIDDTRRSVRTFCADGFPQDMLPKVTAGNHKAHGMSNGSSLTYSAVDVPDVFVAVDLSLGDKWINDVGFNHVRFIVSADALALPDHFFANLERSVQYVTSAMSHTIWHINFLGDAREVTREIETIGQFIEAELSRRDAERALLNYDGIGHSLRTFVEATGYRGALQLVRHVEKGESRISSQSQKRLRQVQQSLLAFEHAEGLGNLLRLHGWLNAIQTDSALITPKILRCFDGRIAELIPKGVFTLPLIGGYKGLLRVLASFIANRFDVEVRIIEAVGVVAPECVPPGSDVVTPLQGVAIPGLLSNPSDPTYAGA